MQKTQSNSRSSGLTPLRHAAARHHSQDEMRIDIYNLWNAKTKEEEQIFKAVRHSQVFAPDRAETFVRFNYRHTDHRAINYDSAFDRILAPKSGIGGVKIPRGSMHVNELWCEKNLEELMGNLPFPKDRLKILNSYKLGVTMKTSKWKRKTNRKEKC
jgi:hypothetical protein